VVVQKRLEFGYVQAPGRSFIVSRSNYPTRHDVVAENVPVTCVSDAADASCMEVCVIASVIANVAVIIFVAVTASVFNVSRHRRILPSAYSNRAHRI